MRVITAHEGSRKQWVIRVNEQLSLFLKDEGPLTKLNLLSPCCTAYVDWSPLPLPPPNRGGRIFCGECGKHVWTRLDADDSSRSHYCAIDSPLIQDWCELAMNPLEAVLAADEISEIARDLLGLIV